MLCGLRALGTLVVTHTLQFLANDPTNNRLDLRWPLGGNRPKRLVDHALVVAATRGICLAPEPVQDVIVETDRNSRLPGGSCQNRSSFPLFEIVLLAHGYSSS